MLDEYGRTERFVSIDNKQEDIQVVVDEPIYEWSIIDEDFEEPENNEVEG